jgi:hypothetical protein
VGPGQRQAATGGPRALHNRGVAQGQLAVPREAEPQRHGKRKDPLTHGSPREHVVHEVRGALVHAPAGARRTESAVLARERHRPRRPAAVAPQQREPVLGQAAGEVVLELFAGVPGDPHPVLLARSEERLQVLVQHLVQQVLPSRGRDVRGHPSRVLAAAPLRTSSRRELPPGTSRLPGAPPSTVAPPRPTSDGPDGRPPPRSLGSGQPQVIRALTAPCSHRALRA